MATATESHYATVMADLPEFDHPPLEEVVIGVQFQPLGRFKAAHLGLFWTRIRDQYPTTEDHAVLAHIEEFAAPRAKGNVQQFELGSLVIPRCWFVSHTGNYIIQIQPDRFLRNWRRQPSNPTYPRFQALIREFHTELDRFLRFVEEVQLGPVVYDQCELTYVNHIDNDIVAKGGFAGAFSLLKETKGLEVLGSPEMLNLVLKSKLPQGDGRLHIQLNPAFRAQDLKMIQVLSITARGAPQDSDVFGWLERAHQAVVRSFQEFTVPSLHEIWGKK